MRKLQRAKYFMDTLRITQDEFGMYSHVGSQAIDWGGDDTGISPVYAPFDMVIVRVRSNANGEVYVRSKEKLELADGTVDYVSMLFIHGDNRHLKAGQEFKQGERFYAEGGWALGRPNKLSKHLHTEVAKGIIHPHQYKNGCKSQYGSVYVIPNQTSHRNIFFIQEDVKLKNGLSGFKPLPKEEVQKEEEKKQEPKFNWRLVNPVYQATKEEVQQIHDDIVKELGWDGSWLLIEKVD